MDFAEENGILGGLSIIESLDEVCIETKSGVMSGDLNILGAIWGHETDFKNIGKTHAVNARDLMREIEHIRRSLFAFLRAVLPGV